MLVSELIEKLKELPQDSTVLIYDISEDTIHTVEKVTNEKGNTFIEFDY